MAYQRWHREKNPEKKEIWSQAYEQYKEIKVGKSENFNQFCEKIDKSNNSEIAKIEILYLYLYNLSKIIQGIIDLPKGKATGLTGIPNEALKLAIYPFSTILLNLSGKKAQFHNRGRNP